jgi:Na+/H+ antiporter NhaD/arsenite permease-like protein
VSPLPLVVVDLVALVVAIIGFHMAFRQRVFRSWVRRLTGRPPKPEEPTHTILLIAGVMLMALGLIIVTLFTAFSLEVSSLRSAQG